MKAFEITVSREWTEPGYVRIKADSPEEAREIAQELLADDSDKIRWNGSNMEPGKDEVESVREIGQEESDNED